jgi:hypothetical protein
LGENGSGSRAHVGAGPINVVLIGRTRKVRARAILGLTAMIAVKVVQASPPRWCGHGFFIPLARLIIRTRLLLTSQRQARRPRAAGKQGWTMGNPDNSTDISDSDHARRTALEAPW